MKIFSAEIELQWNNENVPKKENERKWMHEKKNNTIESELCVISTCLL